MPPKRRRFQYVYLPDDDEPCHRCLKEQERGLACTGCDEWMQHNRRQNGFEAILRTIQGAQPTDETVMAGEIRTE